MSENRKPFDLTVGIAFAGFIVLGLPDALLGLGWPSMRDAFDQPLHALGQILAAMTAAFVVTGFLSGPVVARFGIGRTLLVAFTVRGLGLASFAIAPAWAFILLASVFWGFGSGLVDAGLNTYVAGYRSTRLMNWLHGFYGLGATAGSFAMTAILGADLGWETGYLLVGGTNLVITALLLTTLARWQGVVPAAAETAATDAESEAPAAPLARTLQLPVVWISIGLFLFYTGLELSAGNWAFVLFTDGRGIAEGLAGAAVTFYWGTFTAGRFFFGAVGDRIAVVRLMRWSILGMVLGTGLLWSNLAPIFGPLGLAVLGFALAPAFPTLIGSTEARVGPRHAANTIGFQVGSASVGAAGLPWIVGILAEGVSLEIIGLLLFGMALAIFTLHEILVRLARRYGGATAPALSPAAGDD